MTPLLFYLKIRTCSPKKVIPKCINPPILPMMLHWLTNKFINHLLLAMVTIIIFKRLIGCIGKHPHIIPTSKTRGLQRVNITKMWNTRGMIALGHLKK
jgi:hypothetical protein